MAMFYQQIGGKLSFFKIESDWSKSLPFCQFTTSSNDVENTQDELLLYEIYLKCLKRGILPFPSYETESLIVQLYGKFFNVQENNQNTDGSIKYIFDDSLLNCYSDFDDLLDPWTGNPDDVEFDPEHPHNEKVLFENLIKGLGTRVAHCATPQIELSKILLLGDADSFMAQRGDLLLSFPNGNALLIEPGDHDYLQISLDKRRDAVFNKIGIKTLRPRNHDIGTSGLYKNIEQYIKEIGGYKYLGRNRKKSGKKQIASNYLFLLPSLIARIEYLLLHFLLKCGLCRRPGIKIGVVERDLECAELGLASFLGRLSAFSRLYNITLNVPEITLFVLRNPDYRFADLSSLRISAKECDSLDDYDLDLVLDVGIKCNSLTGSIKHKCENVGTVRQTFVHNEPVRFGYLSRIRPITINNETPDVLNTLVRDFFRKKQLRPGQTEILLSVLSQKHTIGLLPTSAGKSLCYQLASLVTPGTTIIVDPIVALMNDQVQSLNEQYNINRVFAWHGDSKLHDKDVGSMILSNIMLFISPERLLRPKFRSAMHGIKAADSYINYAVIDEAHCVSMWGHDFRPSYLTLERNFNKFFSFQGRKPVIVALTGTASQLVLIDLKRELNIDDMDAIIRPKTFNRPELNFNLIKCPSKEKNHYLKYSMENIARRLNVQNLHSDACGIIFAYTPDELWELFGGFVGEAKEYVRTILTNRTSKYVSYGIYTGKPPKECSLNADEWNRYKQMTLSMFKQGIIKMLFGNTAVSVGIDNEQINYIINYKMPQSMEAYYQQCGRAGRSGQKSECFLLFSDDMPPVTQQWLERKINKMPNRYDCIGTVAYFHETNFPGQEKDIIGANQLFASLFGQQPKESGFVEIRNTNERTELYLSYWLIMGVIEDYEAVGMSNNSTYNVYLHPVIKQYLKDRNDIALNSHLITSLHKYLSRYKPTLRSEVENIINSKEGKLSGLCIRYLIEFIYSQIEYQRREAIGTMVSFCNENDVRPELLRDRIRAYFDSSEKFSEGLIAMADSKADFNSVALLLERIERYDDAEHLYWETRRLLDERFRSDWAAANLFAIAYREKAVCSEMFIRLFGEMVTACSDDNEQDAKTGIEFIVHFLASLTKLDDIFNEHVSASLIAQCMGFILKNRRMSHLTLLNELDLDEEYKDFISLFMANIQTKEVLDANYSRIIR